MIPDDIALEMPPIRLRPLIVSDCDSLQAMTDDPAILQNISFMPASFDRDAALALIAQQDEMNRFLAILHDDTESLIGVFGLHLDDRQIVEIGYWLGSAWHGQGLASLTLEAVLNWTSKHHLEWTIRAECHPGNKASMRLLIKHGFVDSGKPGHRPGRNLFVYSGT